MQDSFLKQNFTIDESTKEARLDLFLSRQLCSSRSQIEALIKKEGVWLNGKKVHKTGIKLRHKDHLEVQIPKPSPAAAKQRGERREIEILYEDEAILVLNKPAHLIVHAAASHNEPTLVDWLKEGGFSLSTLSGERRYGIVHRLDKDTTGAIMIAKSNAAHISLSKQLKDRSMGRCYLAVIDGGLKQQIEVENYLGRAPKNRLKICALNPEKYPGARYAKSLFTPLLDSVDFKFQIIKAQLFTGRTHQIRAHLECLSRHIIADPLYGVNFDGRQNPAPNPDRILLHAFILYFIHPITKKPMFLKAQIFNDMLDFLLRNFHKDCVDDLLQKDPMSFFSS